MYPTNMTDIPPQRALMTLRIIWFTLMLSPIAFLAVIKLGAFPIREQVEPQPLFFWIDLGMFLIIVPITYLVRYLIFRRASVEGRIPAASFTTGNIIFWAGCEGIAFASLALAQLNGSLWPTIVIAVGAMALQALTFPLGKRMYDPTNAQQKH